MDLRRNCLALQFAVHAGRCGWSERSLRRFCADKGISEDQRRRRWPKGVRSLGWQLTAVADQDMLVRKVMLYDPLHPIQAVRRMQRTAHAMLACMPRMDRAPSRFEVAALNAAYTVIVFVWLFDRTPGQILTSRTTASATRLIGQR